MAKISALLLAQPLTGEETLPVVQDSVTRRLPLTAIFAASEENPDAALKANAAAVGVLPGATHLGAMNVESIPDNLNAKQALQALAQSLEARAAWATPEQFSYADDTDRIQAALDTGKTVLLAGSYLSRGNVQSRDDQTVIVSGTVRKAPGTVNTLLEIAGDRVRMIGSGKFQDFNRTAYATVFAGQTTIQISNLSGGSIRYYEQDGYAKGTPVYGLRLLPGTRIIGGPTASAPPYGNGGGAGAYTIDRPAPFDWSGPVMFIDAETFWWGNRSIFVSGADFEGTAHIFGSAGDALTIEGPRARLHAPRGEWLHDNGLLIKGPTSGGFFVDNPDFRGSGWQNTLFVTAGDQVVGGTDYVHGGVLNNPTGLYAGDTALELGYHSKDIEVTGVARLDSHFPPVLLRDTKGCRIHAALLYDFMPHHASWSHIAVVPSTEGPDWDNQAVISNVRSFGPKPPRCFAYLGQSGVEVTGCEHDTGETDPADTATNAIAIGLNVSDIHIHRNRLRGYENAVHANWGATIGNEITRLDVHDNDFRRATRILQAAYVNFHDSRSVNNKFTSVSDVAPYNLNYSSIAPSGENPALNLTIADDVEIAAVSAAGTPTPLFEPHDAALLGIATNLNTSAIVMPEVAGGLAPLTDLVTVKGQMLRIWTDEGTEQGLFWIDGVGNTTQKIAGTANLLDQSGFAGSAGWSLGYFFGQLVLRRCGADTGRTVTRHLLWSCV
ncbi:hypothetical protein [Sphingobium yanoikuyae]|uniref:hypothetical protein n=1 Tax=Sphingobium yanoikuyae TaxID=13690 RepID=UPI002FDC91FE